MRQKMTTDHTEEVEMIEAVDEVEEEMAAAEEVVIDAERLEIGLVEAAIEESQALKSHLIAAQDQIRRDAEGRAKSLVLFTQSVRFHNVGFRKVE